LHKKDLCLLKNFKSFLGVGEIYKKEKSCNYMVQSLGGLRVVIDHGFALKDTPFKKT